MFPTPWTVQHAVWVDGGTDAHGNDIDAWAAPVDVKVMGWSAPTSDERASGRVVIDLAMYCPPGVTGASRDRWILPDGLYEQQGPGEDYTHGPFGWAPGVVINLQRVEG
jgi:hypothetical protein